MSSFTKCQVVVVGGSSGAAVAAQLSKARAKFDPAKNDRILISQLPYHVHMLASARFIATFEGSLDSESQAFIPFDHLFAPGNSGKFIHGKVVEVHEDYVQLEDGRSIIFDFLLLALGSRWPAVLNFDYTTNEQVKSHINSWRDRISEANSVVIIGGGGVGIELASEIKHYYPRKAVSIVHGGPALLNTTYPDLFRDKVVTRLRTLGINVLLGEMLVEIPAAKVFPKPIPAKTLKGTEITAELFIPCFGPTPNTDAIQSLREGGALTSDGHVRITSTFNVALADGTVLDNVWAIGDIISWKEQHQFGKANTHASIAAYNILEVVKLKETGAAPKFKVYKGFPEAIALTLGPSGGIGYLPFLWGITMSDWTVTWIKSEKLFLNWIRPIYGLKAPSQRSSKVSLRCALSACILAGLAAFFFTHQSISFLQW